MALLDYGFNQYKSTLLYKKGDVVGTTNLEKANIDKINLLAEEDITLLTKKVENLPEYKYEIELYNLKYPIKKGDVVGILNVKANNKTIKKTKLITDKDITKISIIKLYFKLFKSILSAS